MHSTSQNIWWRHKNWICDSYVSQTSLTLMFCVKLQSKILQKNSSELLSTYQELLTKYTFFVNFVSFLAISLSMRFLVVMVLIVWLVVMVCCVIRFNWWILTKWCGIGIAGDLWTYRKLNGPWNIRFFRQGEDLAIEWWRKVHHTYVEAVSLFTSVITVRKI